MGRSAGTGSPVWFRCAVARREGPGDDREHVVVRTGRERPYRTRRYQTLGYRSDNVTREYRCTCGHVGWSNHLDLRNAPLA